MTTAARPPVALLPLAGEAGERVRVPDKQSDRRVPVGNASDLFRVVVACLCEALAHFPRTGPLDEDSDADLEAWYDLFGYAVISVERAIERADWEEGHRLIQGIREMIQPKDRSNTQGIGDRCDELATKAKDRWMRDEEAGR